MSEPLWTNERIGVNSSEAADELDGGPYRYHVISQLLVKIRGDYEAQLANQYQRIDRFVELVDQLERKLAEATEANTSCTIYIASQMDRITELEQERVTLWHTINTQATYAEELEAQLAESREDYRVADNENGRLREFKQLLEAQLAQTWQPVEDGEYNNVMVARNGEVLSVLERDDLLGYSFWSGRFIADNIRLCRVVTQEPTL